MQEVTHALRLALAGALALVSPAAPAVALGDVQVRSALGEALDARIPFTIPEGGSVDATCFALVRESGDDAPQALGEAMLTIERRRGETALRIRTLAPVLEPAITVRVRAACRSQDTAGTRQYSLLLDPRAGSALAMISAATVAARLDARDGDTLESMASKVYPRNRDARRRYLVALRSLNPALAAQDERAPIQSGTSIALPDPRTIPRHVRVPRAETRVAKAPVPQPVGKAAAPRVAVAPQPRPAAPKRAAPTARIAPSSGFVLKLSSGEVDLSRSRQIDDRMRAQLRERLLVLDADDQVAAMLSMRNSLRQLEARVADMQLKLDAMPASLAARSALVPVPEKAAAPPVVAKVEAPPPKVESPSPAPKIDPPPPAPKIEPPPPAPKIEPPAAKVEPPAAKPVTAPARPDARAASPPEDGLPEWLWGVAALLVAGAALIAWRLRQRRHARPANEWTAQRQAEPVEPTVQGTLASEEPIEIAAESPLEIVAESPIEIAADSPLEIAAEVRPEMTSDATLQTRLAGDSGELRRRYIEERFPEIQNGTIALGDPASVVKGARLFYEDGALTRAVELLQFCIEDRPTEARPWLALFEIFRLERLTGEFSGLAKRFREQHGKSDYWRKVQYFGREIDPGNALYREEQVNTLETIGPREAKRLAAGLSSVGPTSSFDPIAENWLNAPMDFQNEVLANELRMKLMTEALLTEQDLVANPMPALRNVEMFTVA